MSKMVAPEMDVVRFRESDVIVASMGVMTLSGFNNDVGSDGNINYKGTNYSIANGNAYSLSALLGADKTHVQATVSPDRDPSLNTFDNLFEADFDSGDSSSFGFVKAENGSYYWSEGYSMWMLHQ